MLRVALLAAMAAVWWLAIAAWPDLPDRIPLHFDAAGRPDGDAPRSPWLWFGLPAFATCLGAALGLILPGWTRAAARRNSPRLNMPDAIRFQALPEASRLRAVEPMAGALQCMALLLQGLFAWIVNGIAAVATGAASTLPSTPVFGFVAGIVATAGWMLVAIRRAVAREFAAQHGR
ncbi:MAG: DUF1648 domain-containing protein [Planctomycetes bacterium]|jgi:uncharacterized membrane protein|nr:DUF1648 domain-containing protein [Planctomycetota bacterium]